MSNNKLKTVRIVGSGLIGTSIGLGLVQRGVSVDMVDSDPRAQSLANDLVGGVSIASPDLVVLAMPTSQLSAVISEENQLNPQSTFIDVGSVKYEVVLHVKSISGLSRRFLPTHPMAGREIGGASSARADLFQGRSWILTPSTEVDSSSRELVLELITHLGATPIELSALDHDRAVARISHLPQIASSLIAKQLTGTPPEWMELAGQGLRDTTRIAIFNECAAMDVNVEDLNIEHSPGQLSALITLALSQSDAEKLSTHLTSIGWNVHPVRK